MQWKKICVENNDQYVVFADIVNKIARSSGKYVPILLVLSTSSMLLLDQRTLQIKYRIPASEIYRMSLSPFVDDIAVFHVKAVSVFYILFAVRKSFSISFFTVTFARARLLSDLFVARCRPRSSNFPNFSNATHNLFVFNRCRYFPNFRCIFYARIPSTVMIP